MPPMTFPNQRMVCVHRERIHSDFLGIKNANWQAASRDLGAHALQLYLYLASNSDNYTLALSPVAVRQAIGMARSTYHDQFHKLVDKGYLVPSTGNTFEFYEVPQAASQSQKEMPNDGLNFEKSPGNDGQEASGGHSVLPENTEINNNMLTDKAGINNGDDAQTKGTTIRKPEVKEIVISRPIAEGRNRPKPKEKSKQEVFEF